MQQENFTQFNDDIKTKDFKGLTLVWSPEDERYILPLPESESAGKKYLFDEPTGQFIQVMVNNPDFFYRDRKATAPDGTVLRERVFIGKDRTGATVEIPDPEFQKTLLIAEQMELRLQFVRMGQISVPLFFIGVLITLISFFWNLAGSAGIVAKSFASGSVAAMSEVGYFLAWAGTGVVVALSAWYGIPALFRLNSTVDVSTAKRTGTAEQTSPSATTNIIVKNVYGPESGAQDYITNRDIIK